MKTATRDAKKTAKKVRKRAEKNVTKATKKARRGADELSGRVKDSDALAKAEELAARAQKVLEDAHIDEKVAELADRLRESDAFNKAQAKGAHLAERTKSRIADAHIDERVTEMADRVRESDAAQKASETAKRLSESGLAAVGAWLAAGKAGEKLGVQPRKRGFPVWLAALLGVAAGYAVGVFTAPRRGEELRESFVQTAQQFADDPRGSASDLLGQAKDAAEKPLAAVVRETLDSDPRTSALPDLTINVAEGTVFIRGTVPGSFDQQAVRDLVSAVPGVKDVDLQVDVDA